MAERRTITFDFDNDNRPIRESEIEGKLFEPQYRQSLLQIETYLRELELEKTEGTISTYKVALALTYPGLFKFGIRIFPSNTLLPHKQDFPLLKWL